MNSTKKQYIAPQIKKLSVVEAVQKANFKIDRNNKPAFTVPALVLKTN